MAVWPALRFAVAAAAAVLAAAALAEAALLRGVVMDLERAPALALALGQREELAVRLRLRARWQVHLVARQVWPPLVSPRTTVRRGRCRPGEVLNLSFELRGRSRGRAEAGALGVAATLFGLAERCLAVGGPLELTVLPSLGAIARTHARLNQWALRGLGSRTSARLGKGREFDRLRDYVPGDEPRDIAWKSSARHAKLIVREYRLDRTQHVLVCVDRGHRMAARVAGLSKLDHAISAALLLAYMANRMEDRSSLIGFAAEAEQGPAFGRGAAHLRHVTEFVSALRADRVHSDYLALAAAVRGRARQRTLVAILTALPEVDPQALLGCVRLLSPRHLPLVVVLTDPDLQAAAEILPASAAEAFRTLAARDLVRGREQTVRQLRRLGALVVEARPTDAGVAAMNSYIEAKRRQML